MSSTLFNLSNDLAAAVERASASVVAVHGRRRLPSSGVIWRPGFIVTAESALRRDEEISVTLPSGETVPANLKGRDATTDLALLACETGPATAATFAAAPLKAGQIVLTVGRTADTGPIATMGVLSGVSGEWRTWRGGKLDQFARLDVAVYPTSVGGAVADAEGALLGIVAGGLSRSSVLAITRPTLDRVAEALSTKGRIARGYIGIGLQPVAIPAAVKSALNLDQNTGVMALSVEENGPAARAGVLMGDVVLTLAGHPITGVEALQAALDPASVGRQLPLTILRGGASHQLSVTVAERPGKGQ